MSEIIMTPEEKSADLKARVTKFREGMIALSEQTGVNIQPQIAPLGPVIVLYDVKTNRAIVQDEIK